MDDTHSLSESGSERPTVPATLLAQRPSKEIALRAPERGLFALAPSANCACRITAVKRLNCRHERDTTVRMGAGAG